MNRLLFSALLWAALAVTPAVAAPKVGDWTGATGDAKTILRAWLAGAADELLWVNARATNTGKPRLYCQPDNIALRQEQLEDIIDRYIARRGEPPSSGLGDVLLDAMIDVFPCASRR